MKNESKDISDKYYRKVAFPKILHKSWRKVFSNGIMSTSPITRRGVEDFSKIAKQYSIAPNASDGGDLGVFDISSFSTGIKDSIALLKKGEYTDVIQTAQGFQIFFVVDIEQGETRTFEQARDEIYETLYREQVTKKFETWLDSLKKKAHIKILL